jgi:ankyrin repeat protein
MAITVPTNCAPLSEDFGRDLCHRIETELPQALHKAMLQSLSDQMKVLRASGADIDAQDQHGETALHEAASVGDLDLVGILISAGADINVQDERGQTPLHKAAIRGHWEVMEALRAAGADLYCKDRDGRSPFRLWAMEYPAIAQAKLIAILRS